MLALLVHHTTACCCSFVGACPTDLQELRVLQRAATWASFAAFRCPAPAQLPAAAFSRRCDAAVVGVLITNQVEGLAPSGIWRKKTASIVEVLMRAKAQAAARGEGYASTSKTETDRQEAFILLPCIFWFILTFVEKELVTTLRSNRGCQLLRHNKHTAPTQDEHESQCDSDSPDNARCHAAGGTTAAAADPQKADCFAAR